MKKLTILSTLLFIYIFAACSSSSNDDDMNPSNDITYNGTIKIIMDNNCLICHSNPPVNLAPMSLTTYESVKEAVENRALINLVVDGDMPPSGNLTAVQIQAIMDWETGGFIQ